MFDLHASPIAFIALGILVVMNVTLVLLLTISDRNRQLCYEASLDGEEITYYKRLRRMGLPWQSAREMIANRLPLRGYYRTLPKNNQGIKIDSNQGALPSWGIMSPHQIPLLTKTSAAPVAVTVTAFNVAQLPSPAMTSQRIQKYSGSNIVSFGS